MATIEFKRKDFIEGDSDEFYVKYTEDEIGQGSNLIVEVINEDGLYDVVQVPIKRSDDNILICFSTPVDGRLIFEKYD